MSALTMPLTQEQLAMAGCEVPGCDHGSHGDLWLHARCHPTSGTRCRYVRSKGEIEVSCRKCGALVVEILVAKARERN